MPGPMRDPGPRITRAGLARALDESSAAERDREGADGSSSGTGAAAEPSTTAVPDNSVAPADPNPPERS